MKHAFILALFCVTLLPSEHIKANEPAPANLVDKVLKAIDKAERYLWLQQDVTNDGQGFGWERDLASRSWPGGTTALAVLALASASDRPNDPKIERGLRYLRQVEPKNTYVVALQTMVFAEFGQPKDISLIQRNVDWLLSSRVIKNNQLQGWSYTANGNIADNSNTRFAVLGLWAARQAGAKVPPEAWEAIGSYYLRTQMQDRPGQGSWYYVTYASRPPYPSLTMTAGSLTSLLLSTHASSKGRETLTHGATAVGCGAYADHRALAMAERWLVNNYRLVQEDNFIPKFYWLDCLWRLGQVRGKRYIGEHDWFREGCAYLVSSQHEDGSWYVRNKGFDSYPVVSTSFAMLFLTKGRTPVLVSKLVHGVMEDIRTDWNHDRHDIAHLTEYARTELFKRKPLGWQIFNARETQPATREEVNHLTGELLQSPLAYFNGHDSPQFASWEKEMLRQYVTKGGTLLADACCNSQSFDKGFRRLMKELFPDAPLRPLPNDHPLWKAHAQVPSDAFPLEGVEVGGRTAVIYSRQDLSCLWEANQFVEGRGQLAFRLGANIIAYATRLEVPKPRRP